MSTALESGEGALVRATGPKCRRVAQGSMPSYRGQHRSGARVARDARGASLIVILIVVFFVLLLATFGLKFGTSYTQFLTLRGIMADVVAEPNAASRNMAQIWTSIDRRLTINSIYDRERDDFSLVTEDGVRYLVVEYEVRKPFIANIDVVTHFRHAEPFE